MKGFDNRVSPPRDEPEEVYIPKVRIAAWVVIGALFAMAFAIVIGGGAQ